MMEWEEAVISTGSLLFSIALLPTVLGKEARVPWRTSLLTAIVLTAYIPAFWSINQPYSAGTSCLTAASWWFIFFRRRL